GRKGRGGLWGPISQLRTKTRTKHMHTPLWLFTGTPVVKDATDVWPLLYFANPYRYSSRREFALEMCKTTQTPYALHIGPVRDREKFRNLLGKHSIRRTWDQIPELSTLNRRDIQVPLELDPVDLRRHRKIKKEYRDPLTDEALFSSSAMLHALRRLTISDKVDAFTEVVEDTTGRWLCLAWYKDSARLAYDRTKRTLAASGVVPNIVYIDGETSERERRRAIDTYNRYPDTILVGTIGALETGLNLQAGYQVAFLEQHWLPSTNEQAVARVLRRGQEQPVLVYWFHCIKTYDMRVKRVSETRGANIEKDLDNFLEE